MIMSAFFNISFDLKLISSRLPMGVDIIYRPFLKLFILFLLTIIISCSPQNYPEKRNVSVSNIADDLGLEVESLLGLEKAPKATLKKLENAIKELS